jgi:3-oxoacyl-[acyl-carrier protein] reductase
MQLTLAARSQALLDELAKSLSVPSLVKAVDLRDPAAPPAVVAATIDRFGRLDVLVNNAGATQRGDFLSLSDADWQDGFALKFFGAMRCCRAAWPHLCDSRGAVVNIVGIGGRTGTAEFAIGGAVNAALLNLTKVLADRGRWRAGQRGQPGHDSDRPLPQQGAAPCHGERFGNRSSRRYDGTGDACGALR